MPTSNSSLERLNALVGEWDLEILHPDPGVSPGPIAGSSSFEWALGGAFLVQRLTIDHPDFPEWLVVIGPDADDDYIYHYYDSRGVSRTLHMRLGDGTWSLGREDPDFYQRFTGKFSPDGTRIDVRLEMSHDHGRTWKHDFDMTFRKVIRQAGP